MLAPTLPATDIRKPVLSAKEERTRMLDLQLRRIRNATWILGGTVAVLAGFAVILMIFAVKLSDGLAQSREVTEKLQRVDEFERRIVARLDSFNAGVQSLIEKTNGGVYNIRSEVEELTKANREAATSIRSTAAELQARVQSMGGGSELTEDIAPQPVYRSVSGGASPQPSAAVTEAVASGAANFRRITNPDGTTTYQKVR
jgi:hypothetical protein